MMNFRTLTACIAPLWMLCFFLSACSVSKKISKAAKEDVLGSKALQSAHVGITIFDPSSNKHLFNYQGDKYFVPASNTKLATCYAALKYLGDSLPGIRYGYAISEDSSVKLLAIQPMGDPTLLHPDYPRQPVLDFIFRQARSLHNELVILDTNWKDSHLGNGWSWNDYDADYMAERSNLPVYGNVVDIKLNPPAYRDPSKKGSGYGNELLLFKTASPYFDSMVNAHSFYLSKETQEAPRPLVSIKRDLSLNEFRIVNSRQPFSTVSIPFVTEGSKTALQVLAHDYHLSIHQLRLQYDNGANAYLCDGCPGLNFKVKEWKILYSHLTDSLLKPMMHRSDNFFAEQSLLMVSNLRLGYMNDQKIIDTILKTDLKDLPQKPNWADGSGLSRYNLFTPQDIVAILNKMKTEFGMERLKIIMATGGEGTIRSYYKADSGYIYGKTGTLSGVVAFSGFLYTKKGKLLIFSTLVNNHLSSAADVRRAVEKFLERVRKEL